MLANSKVKRVTNGNEFEDFGFSDGLLGDLNDFFSNKNFGNGDFGAAGDNGNGNSDLVLQDDLECPSGSLFKLNEVEASIIRLTERSLGKRGTNSKKASEKKAYITHEDFEEGPERDAFLLIFGYAELLFESSNVKSKKSAIQFFFCNSESEISFNDAVNAIDHSIRVDVIRLRLMLEFWLREWVVGDLPILACSLPSRVELMAIQCAGPYGIDLAREAWFSPGINQDKLISIVLDRDPGINKSDALVAMKNLLAFHVLSERKDAEGFGRLYTTGQNPILQIEEMIMARGDVARSAPNLKWGRMF